MDAYRTQLSEAHWVQRQLLALHLWDYVGEADHPATVWRLALPPDVRVFGWWSGRQTGTAEEPRHFLPYVAWRSDRGWATCPVLRLPDGGDDWDVAGWGQRVHMVARGLRRTVGPEADLRCLVQRVAAGPGPTADCPRPVAPCRKLIGPWVWGLLRLLPEARRPDLELSLAETYPGLITRVRGVDDMVWEVIGAGVEAPVIDGA